MAIYKSSFNKKPEKEKKEKQKHEHQPKVEKVKSQNATKIKINKPLVALLHAKHLKISHLLIPQESPLDYIVLKSSCQILSN